MELVFATKKLAKAASSKKDGVIAWGERRAKIVRRRLAELQAAKNLAEVYALPSARCHELKGDRKGQLAVDLDHPYRLIFEPANEPVPRREDGGYEIEQITEIRVLEIADYH